MRHRNIVFIAATTLSLVVILLLAGFARALPANPGPSGYHILKTIHLGGTEGWDYISIDSSTRRLYVAGKLTWTWSTLTRVPWWPR